MSVPAIALIALGCIAYLGIGFGVAMAFTMDGPPQWWIRVPLRFGLMFGWLPFVVFAPFIGMIGALFS
jgi:hypothetical protein